MRCAYFYTSGMIVHFHTILQEALAICIEKFKTFVVFDTVSPTTKIQENIKIKKRRWYEDQEEESGGKRGPKAGKEGGEKKENIKIS